jgi:hypothetical protein
VLTGNGLKRMNELTLYLRMGVISVVPVYIRMLSGVVVEKAFWSWLKLDQWAGARLRPMTSSSPYISLKERGMFLGFVGYCNVKVHSKVKLNSDSDPKY